MMFNTTNANLFDGESVHDSEDGNVSTVRRGNAIVIQFRGSYILDELTIDAIDADIRTIIRPIKKPRVVLDFCKVEHMSSRMISMVMAMRKHIDTLHGKLLIVRLNPNLREVFAITRIDTRVKILDNHHDLHTYL